MKKLLFVLGFVSFLSAGSNASNTVVVFNDDFNAANGTSLQGRAPLVGTSWNVTSGAALIQNQSFDTSQSTSYTFAFGGLSRALGAGEEITLNFTTLAPSSGKFLTTGWAGISLYTGGSGGTERIFIGSVGGFPNWGIQGGALSGTQILSTITSAAADVSFQYAYNTGNWSLSVGSGSLSGTAAANLAFNTLRIGGDFNNLANINVDSLSASITTIPEPSVASLLALGLGVLFRRSRKRD
jgi:hypothetical protein